MKLGLNTINDLPTDVARPSYDRGDLKPGIVHVGLGNFHRAHMALYLHDLFQLGRDHDWAIIGAGVRASDHTIRDDLAAQDWLTTVYEMDPSGDRAIVTGTMIDFLPVQQDNRPLISAMSGKAIRIVSLTVTEGGYYIDASTGLFDPTHPDMQHDAKNPDTPRSVFGAIIAALKIRRALDIPPFTVMSCDNLPDNGHVARATVIGLAQQIDVDLADWITDHVVFPCAMVDRITPATSDRERAMIRDRFGIHDRRPVTCESFRQWVLEDNFPTGRPAFHAIGVTLTDDVAPYELMKIRILNGGHAAMAYPAALLGIHFVHDAAHHPLIRGFLNKLETEEILPNVPPVPNTDLAEYYKKVIERLENPGVADTIPRLCQDGSNRQPKFILPTVRDQLARGGSINGLSLVSALWCRYLQGTDDNGAAIKIDDPSADLLKDHAKRAKTNPQAFLQLKVIFGDLADNAAFSSSFQRNLEALYTQGTEAVLKTYIG
ncbi:mannitol dehydrogenase family protein [Parasulfitobacter algicola]|uniref:Mannitol dehydrogenase family protein n=1 Tax=Parasulfitobacter algicola TaxID=2614809 RepID=A0ABX2INR3_9RHOB|nr:mannitol dehydrogenase family protein [Sulfitobacter algicola]NSX54527.1 mannitol dehydrogenase family protein [Sulfitobacter algicola]